MSATLSYQEAHAYKTNKQTNKAGEMVQQLRALTALPEDLGSIPSTHMAAHACL